MAETLLRLGMVAAVALATAVGAEILHRILRLIGRPVTVVTFLTRRAHRPFLVLAILVAIDASLRASELTGDWRNAVVHALDLLVIGAAAWLVTALLFVFEDTALARFRTDVSDNAHARTVHTQVTLVRRVSAAAVTVLAIGAMLMTFHEARLIGASLLASAGVVAAVVAFAAQTLLGNVFAGLQLAFGQSLRLEDVVVVDGEWGRIQEITLTYVMVHVWDDRRLIIPTSYFTTTPFQNWTRSGSSLLGAVELDVDWTVPVEELREELHRVVDGTQLWDRRVAVLQVIDAVGGNVRVRALVSAVDAGTLWDLRCLTRERLVGWLRSRHPEALPHQRLELGSQQRHRPRPEPPETAGSRPGSQVFGGDAEGRERGSTFQGPPPEEREPAGDQPAGDQPAGDQPARDEPARDSA